MSLKEFAESDSRRYFDFAPAPLAVVERAGSRLRVSAVNAAFLHITSLTRPQVVDQPLEAVLTGAASVQLRYAFEQCLAGSGAVAMKISQAVSGELVRFAVRIQSLDRASAIMSLDRLGAEDGSSAMGEAGILAELSALSRGLVFIQDLERNVSRYGDHPLADILGLGSPWTSNDQLLSKLHPDDVGAFRDYTSDQRRASDEDVLRTTMRVRDAQGDWVWVELRSRVFIRDPAGAVTKILAVATDVTDTHIRTHELAIRMDAVARAEIEERRRVGRELHDSTSQHLLSASLSLAAVQGGTFLTPEAKLAVDEARQAIFNAQAEVRSIAFTLHAPTLESGGLGPALGAFVDGFARRTELPVSFELRGARRLPASIELALYRIAQEALMNVYRHASASRAQVRLSLRPHRAVLEVEDDGVGLSAPKPGVGIGGMRARLALLGGRLDFKTSSSGLRVRASVPIQRTQTGSLTDTSIGPGAASPLAC